MTKKKETRGEAAKIAPRQKVAKPKATKLERLEAMLRQPAGATIKQPANP